MDELEVTFDPETGMWGKKEEPYATIEIATEADYNRLVEMIDYWNKHHDAEGREI